ncbi:MOSC N-terminal beta barrel domain-containing protein [Streptomyces sp. NA04227]|uniref:MOSC domain-containing protein n=1 Tax=Streptomyces sp. NA04227 TaxID=2742136 RepID=UPI00158FC406|nr:MOSC N-terminal beta barrel domain-containing protein [Streptomyces sp. NA04227]QKW07638.1 MOSC N-terminal beta barrel domain-containing protein [Streptomyces sp. NA04227]
MAEIVELVSYPIKGCAGTSLRAAELTAAGLRHDRSFMVTDEAGVFRSQRRDPRLAVVRPTVTSATTLAVPSPDASTPVPDGSVDLASAPAPDRLTLEAPGIEPLTIDVDTEGARRDVTLFKNPFQGIDQGDEAAAWLSEVLGGASRLVRVPPEHDRVTDGATPGTSGYADSTALMMVSRSSLDLLQEWLAKRDEAPLPMNRFRPNIVVDGWDEPHTEDRVRRVRAGDTLWGWSKPCIRCAVTTVDQAAGVKAGVEPLRTLADYRRAESGGVAFGAKFAVLRGGRLKVGDSLVVEEWGPGAV